MGEFTVSKNLYVLYSAGPQTPKSSTNSLIKGDWQHSKIGIYTQIKTIKEEGMTTAQFLMNAL